MLLALYLLSRLSILAKVQKRLARLDELRQAAKNAVEMRFEKERDELGNLVESRAQRAELNRRVLLKCRQRKAAKRERISQLLTRRAMQESKYRECVRAAIHRKRAAAEKKRLGFLEAERSKARARILQVKQIANSVYSQREIERIRLKDQLEDRLQKVCANLNECRRLLCILYKELNMNRRLNRGEKLTEGSYN